MENRPQEPQDLSYLEDASVAGGFIQDVKSKIAEMRRLEMRMLGAEAEYKDAKAKFEAYKATAVVAAFTSAGITQIQDEQGNSIKLVPKYYCNPNKNDEDRMKLAQWLEHNGGEHLLKHEGKVSADQYDALKEAGIPFADKLDVNTNSLKAHLMDLLGYKKGSQARIDLTAIPDYVHFVIDNDVVTE